MICRENGIPLHWICSWYIVDAVLQDERYAKYIGKQAIVPLTFGRHVPIISDKVGKVSVSVVRLCARWLFLELQVYEVISNGRWIVTQRNESQSSNLVNLYIATVFLKFDSGTDARPIQVALLLWPFLMLILSRLFCYLLSSMFTIPVLLFGCLQVIQSMMACVRVFILSPVAQ